MQVVLLRVGIDMGSGGILGPLFSDGSFEFIPIPDGFRVDDRTYGNTMGRHGKPLAEYFPTRVRRRMSRQPMHVDPEFETFTYGDPSTLKAGLRRLKGGDLLVFYAGLKGYDCEHAPALYIVGYFEVALAGRACEFGERTTSDTFGANFHVKHQRVFSKQRDHLTLIKGSSASRLFDRAVKISEDGRDVSGRRIHVLSRQMLEVFGDFDGHIAIQRSPPRWVEPPFIDRAAAFVREHGKATEGI